MVTLQRLVCRYHAAPVHLILDQGYQTVTLFEITAQ